MPEGLQIIGSSIWAAIAPMGALIGLWLAVDRVASPRGEALREYRRLREQALFQRCLATARFLDKLSTLEEYAGPEPPQFIREYWLRLEEIREREREVAAVYRWLERERSFFDFSIVGGLLLSVSAVIAEPSRAAIVAVIFVAFVACILTAFDLRRRSGKLDTFGEHAFFRGRLK